MGEEGERERRKRARRGSTDDGSELQWDCKCSLSDENILNGTLEALERGVEDTSSQKGLSRERVCSLRLSLLAGFSGWNAPLHTLFWYWHEHVACIFIVSEVGKSDEVAAITQYRRS